MGVKSLARKLAAGTIGGLGLAPALGRLTGGRAAILAYHRVLDPANDDLDLVEPGMFVTRETFADHCDYLAANCRVIGLSTLLRRLLTGEKIVRGTVALTFDDGWLDNFENALPVLRNRALPATIFVPTGLVDTRHRFWFSRAAAAAAGMWQRRASLIRAFPDQRMPAAAKFLMTLLVEQPKRPRFVQAALAACKNVSPEAREEVVAFMEELAEDKLPSRRELVTWDELRQMAQGGFEIGSHTVNHVILTQCDSSTARAELELSRRQIVEQLGAASPVFCYPNGDHNASLRQLVARSGYAGALTTAAGFADRHPDLFALPRLGVHQGVAPSANGLALLLTGLGI